MESRRVETGVVRFGEDWPGYFLRGDDALSLQARLARVRQYFEALGEEKLCDVMRQPLGDLVIEALARLSEFEQDLGNVTKSSKKKACNRALGQWNKLGQWTGP